jgi:hypothetical protein
VRLFLWKASSPSSFRPKMSISVIWSQPTTAPMVRASYSSPARSSRARLFTVRPERVRMKFA